MNFSSEPLRTGEVRGVRYRYRTYKGTAPLNAAYADAGLLEGVRGAPMG